MSQRTKRATALAVCAVLLLCAGSATTLYGPVIYRKNSLYHRIFVHRSGQVVTLRFGRSKPDIAQSRVDLSNPHRHVHEYTTLAYAGFLYKPEPENLLLLGLGGGVMPRDMRHYFPDLRMDLVELDPAIPPLARRFFNFRTDDRMDVHIQDGRIFIREEVAKEETKKHDMIILDAFRGDYIPFHLMTREFLEEVRKLLADDGVVVANVIYTNRLAHAEMKTFQAVFERCQVYQGKHSTNAMLVAPDRDAPVLTPREALRRAGKLQEQHNFGFDIRNVARRLVPDARAAPGARVLTDDQAPVNWLRQQEAAPFTPAGEE